MTAPRGPGKPGGPQKPPAPQPAAPPAGRPKMGEPGSIDAMIKKRQAEDRIKDEAERQKRQKRNRILMKLGAGLLTGVIIAAGVLWFLDSRKGCGATERRRQALATIMEQGDQEAGTLIKERFPDKDLYRCIDHAGPRGILVSVSEDGGDPIVWFVNNDGVPQNVNLLAVSWTPKLAAAPNFSDKDIAKVLK